MKLTQRTVAVLLAGILCSPVYSLNYTVKPSDTLFGLSLKYDVPQERIARVNNLEGNGLRIGQELLIPLEGVSSITVRPGDTLSALSIEFDVPVADIMSSNSLTSTNLRIGDELRIPESVPDGLYRVAAGDTLTGIASRFGLSIMSLKAFNGLEGDTIRPGELLTIQPDRPEIHTVGNGESLWTIADDFGLTMDNLREWNHIEGDVIHPGEVLALFPGIDISETGAYNSSPSDIHETEITLASVHTRPPAEEAARDEIPRYGEYFYSAPDRRDQPNDTYWEEPDASSMTDYRRALNIMKAFDAEIDLLPRYSDALSGWHIVIDPGHGGLDPGAIVTVKDGNGNPLTVTEDEYAYDVSLRMYRALALHGASVSLSILAPDHHIRDGIDARQTFVHRKNEVYNDEAHNGNVGWRPVGTTDGLDMRKEVAADQIQETSSRARRRGTLFISIHADNSADLPAGRAVLYDGLSSQEKEASRSFASVMAANLGAGSFIKEQPLRVLRDNPADAAILVEVRNVNYDRNCWALRSAELREQDALMVVDGVLDWASRD